MSYIRERVEFIAPAVVYPGEDEMLSLVPCGLRVLRGEEKVGGFVKNDPPGILISLQKKPRNGLRGFCVLSGVRMFQKTHMIRLH